MYRKHSMYPGGLKETQYKDMKAKNPDEVRSLSLLKLQTPIEPYAPIQIIRHAVSGMLPKNKLRDRRLERLKVFPSYNMGRLGANVLRSWQDGTLPPDWDPRTPTTSTSLKKTWKTVESS